MDNQCNTKNKTATQNEQQFESKQTFNGIIEKMLNSKSFKDEFQKLITKQIS